MSRTVVLTAFASDPSLPSEPTVGFEYLLTWLRIIETEPENLNLLAFMRETSRDATLERLKELGVDTGRLRIHSPTVPRYLRFLFDPRLTRFEYLLWAAKTARELKKVGLRENVILARHVTFASELLPHPLGTLPPGTASVWGPVGSTGQARAFLFFPRDPKWLVYFLQQKARDFLSARLSRFSARRVKRTLVTSTTLAKSLRDIGVDAEVFPNTRVNLDLSEGEVARPQTDPEALRLLCVGNLIYLKRFEVVLAALTQPSLKNATLTIAGKPAWGAENPLEPVARHLGVSGRVRFAGQLAREDVLDEMHRADVLIHSSSREGASGVIGEATAVGLPVVVFDGTGASAVLDYSGVTGIKVDARRHRDKTAFAKAIVEASRLPRIRSDRWREDRFEMKERSLLEWARNADG